ncbi:hypothetical protein LOTGIDRAFT_235369 [Lottia gigantea]|uniref:Securin n=1 Tax=Lottia gigantea TaxID=225164 RepID=V4BDG9_LOTGI|nr:hypothetical protein LOTGIDRAFT_235369 [Lottia gigantea]ESO86579.1 hypothetical protein LOTGIDRAFT_235369 [Lottia gigantea]
MSALQIHNQDKENAGARPKGNRLPLGSGSNFNRIKSFQGSNTPAFVTPRKALGNAQNILNQTPHNLKPGGLALKPVSNIKPSVNLHKQSVKSKRHVSFKNNIQDKENVNHKKPMKVKAPVVMQIDNNQRVLDIDEVDHMSIPPEIQDNRVPPPEEKISNYLEKIIKWRPPCLFGIPPLSDDDDPVGPVYREDVFDNLDDLTKLDTDGLGHLDDKLFDDIPDILEVDIPYIDETLPTLDLPSPGLDDSINNISIHLGVLQLNDSVLN